MPGRGCGYSWACPIHGRPFPPPRRNDTSNPCYKPRGIFPVSCKKRRDTCSKRCLEHPAPYPACCSPFIREPFAHQNPVLEDMREHRQLHGQRSVMRGADKLCPRLALYADGPDGIIGRHGFPQQLHAEPLETRRDIGRRFGNIHGERETVPKTGRRDARQVGRVPAEAPLFRNRLGPWQGTDILRSYGKDGGARYSVLTHRLLAESRIEREVGSLATRISSRAPLLTLPAPVGKQAGPSQCARRHPYSP